MVIRKSVVLAFLSETTMPGSGLDEKSSSSSTVYLRELFACRHSHGWNGWMEGYKDTTSPRVVWRR